MGASVSCNRNQTKHHNKDKYVQENHSPPKLNMPGGEMPKAQHTVKLEEEMFLQQLRAEGKFLEKVAKMEVGLASVVAQYEPYHAQMKHTVNGLQQQVHSLESFLKESEQLFKRRKD